MQVAFVLYEGLTTLDLIGPYQVLTTTPGFDVMLVGAARGPVRSDTGLQLVAEVAFDEVTGPAIVVVPGTSKPRSALADRRTTEWLREVHPRAQWTTSVCTGSLLLGAAGALQGRRATSHWLALDALRRFGATPTEERVVVDGPVITAAGVSAGIDMGLRLLALLRGESVAQMVQLILEYDPEPPFASGSPRKASARHVEMVRELIAGPEWQLGDVHLRA